MKTKTSFRLLPFNHKDGIIQMLFNYQYKTFDSITAKTKYQPLAYATGITIKKSDWDREENAICKSHPEAKKLNFKLSTLEKEVEAVFNQFQYKGEMPTPHQLRSELDIRMGKVKEKVTIQPLKMSDFIMEFIEKAELFNLKKKTRSNYKTILNIIKSYEDEKRIIVYFSNLTEEVYLNIINWYRENGYTRKKKHFEYKQNQIWDVAKNLSKFIREAFKRKIEVPIDLKSERLLFKQEIPDNIALTFSELDAIAGLDLSMLSKSKIEISRDLFIISAYCGLRYCDTDQLNEIVLEKRIIKGNEKYLLKVKTIKTGVVVLLPCLDAVMKIYKKYNGKFPKAPNNSNYNSFLKKIGKMAGLIDEVNIATRKKGEIVNETFKKYELITSHTGRRTMCTNFYRMGVPVKTIMMLSGHSTTESFFRYIKISAEEHVELVYDIIEAKMPELLVA